MTETSDSRSPRSDGADDTHSLGHIFRGWLRSVLGGRGDETLRETIGGLIEAKDGGSEPSLGDSERVLLTNILQLHDRTVADVMVPRADIVAVEVNTSLPELVRRMADEAHSRLPVYRETLDDVIGMVHIKDVLACVANHRACTLAEIAREVSIVAPSMTVLDLLREMRQTRQHLALVVDEFGGIDGLVTIEDLVEEIVGEIEDEHDEAQVPHLTARPDGSLIADARLSVEDFEETVGTVLTEEEREEVDTLGGLVVSLAGRVPGRGETLRHSSGLEFEIIDADPRRIKRLRIRNAPANTDALAATG